MKSPVTTRQKELLGIIYEYIRDTGFSPSIAEMRERLRVSSNQSVLSVLERLCESKLIKKGVAAARSVAILPFGYEVLDKPALTPFVGTTSAGAPLQSIEVSGEWRQVSPELSRLSEEIFMLKVAGDSMINAGIDDGDAVLVQTKREFVSGEIVYAQIGDDSTIKRFISDDKPPYVYLKPENPKYQNILCTHEMELKGKVISVLKDHYWKSVK